LVENVARFRDIARSFASHRGWVQFAPRITDRVRRDIERLAEAPLTAAEITRIAGTLAEELGFRRPSYQQVRVLVRERREERARVAAGLQEVKDSLFDFLYRPWRYQHHFPEASTKSRSK
jgi:hypothetical protein